MNLHLKTSCKINLQHRFSLENSKNTFKELIQILPNPFQRKEERTLLNSFYKDIITLMPILDKTNKQKPDNYRPTFFMTLEVNILDKILANRIRQYIKRTIYHDAVEFVPEMQG